MAVGQCEALNARGHDTLLVGGSTDLPLSTSRMGAASVRLFPTRRVAGSKPMAYLWSPSMLRWLWRHLGDFDVVHVHLARDGVALPAALIARLRGRPYVVQTHGMVNPRSGIAQRAVDWLATRSVLRRAATVFALRTEEIGQLTEVLGAPRRIDLLPNGIALPPAAAVAGLSNGRSSCFWRGCIRVNGRWCSSTRPPRCCRPGCRRRSRWSGPTKAGRGGRLGHRRIRRPPPPPRRRTALDGTASTGGDRGTHGRCLRLRAAVG